MSNKLLEKLHELKIKFPDKKVDLQDLEFEVLARKEEGLTNFKKYLFFTWTPLFLFTSIVKPLPFFRRIGRVFGTHRVVRHFAYSGIAIYASTVLKSEWNTKATFDKLVEIEGNLTTSDDGYVKPKKPMRVLYQL